MALIVGLTNSYGITGNGFWCWIKTDPKHKIARKLILIYYLFYWTMLVINIYFILIVYCLIKKYSINQSKFLLDYLKYTKHCSYFIIAILVKMIPATVAKIYYIVTNKENEIMSLIQIITTDINGVFLSVLFLTLSDFKSYLKHLCSKFKKLFCCNIKNEIKKPYNPASSTKTTTNFDQIKDLETNKLLTQLTMNIFTKNKSKQNEQKLNK